MLTIAYCRVSTDEQAEEGYSIEGQANRLRAYAELHDLGAVTVVTDPGRSGKDLNRPGLGEVLAMIERGHVAHVLVWRLDRLSRNLEDLIGLADQFGQADVSLHSFTEKLGHSSATGRMFYNILGSFAQFYREQLSENIRMDNAQAIQQGKWIYRPKTGYDLVDGELVANADSANVREIFRLRASGLSCAAIEDRTGIKYSTARQIAMSRIYLGEVLHNGSWFPGHHASLITQAEFDASHKGFVPGRTRRSRELLSGRVRCGLCVRIAAVDYRQNRTPVFRCKHRGVGCSMPRTNAQAIEAAWIIGLRLLGTDAGLKDAIRRQLESAGGAHGPAARAPQATKRPGERSVEKLETQRRKLLELYYADQIGADLYAEEEARLRERIEIQRHLESEAITERQTASDAAEKFEEIASILAELNLATAWDAATHEERKVLVDELLGEVSLFPDHLEVELVGAPRLNILLEEVGVQTSCVRGGT